MYHIHFVSFQGVVTELHTSSVPMSVLMSKSVLMSTYMSEYSLFRKTRIRFYAFHLSSQLFFLSSTRLIRNTSFQTDPSIPLNFLKW